MSVIIDNVCSVEESMQCAFCNQTKNQSFIIGLLGEPRVSKKIRYNNDWFKNSSLMNLIQRYHYLIFIYYMSPF